MSFFDEVGDTLKTAGEDVSQKAKDIYQAGSQKAKVTTRTAKIRLDIMNKENFVASQYRVLGKAYYEDHKGDASFEYDSVAQINDVMEEIENLREELSAIKNTKKCPSCGANIVKDAVFCSKCGTKLSSGDASDEDEEDFFAEDDLPDTDSDDEKPDEAETVDEEAVDKKEDDVEKDGGADEGKSGTDSGDGSFFED